MRRPPCSSCGRPAALAFVLPDAHDPERVAFACQGRHAPDDADVLTSRISLGEDWRAYVARLRQRGHVRAAEMLATAIRERAEAA